MTEPPAEDEAERWPLRALAGAVPQAPAWFSEAVGRPYEEMFVVAQGARIEARAWGPRGAPGLMLVHGSAAHLGWWSFLAPLFADEYRVAVLSLSGMGQSDWRPRYSIDLFVEEIGAAMEAAGLWQAAALPILVGHSMAASPVLRIAAEAAPRIRGAVLVDCALPRPRAERQTARHHTYDSAAAALARFRFAPPQPCRNLFIADYIARMGLKQTEEGRWTWRFDTQLWNDLRGRRLEPDLAAPQAPLAMIRGQDSWLTAPPMIDRMRQIAPPGTPVIEIPGAHHHVMVDQPLALTAAIRRLIEAF